MSSLTSRDRLLILEVARRAVILAVTRRLALADLPETPELKRPCGAFVTLQIRGRLRGCVGRIGGDQPLVRVVADCARSAALEDPRFRPLETREIEETEIELSVLSPLEEIAPARIEVGTHGLVVSRGWRRGVLMPQVALERRWSPERFLEETCVKAGFDRDAWKDPETRIHGFTAEIFCEAEFRSGLPEQ